MRYKSMQSIRENGIAFERACSHCNKSLDKMPSDLFRYCPFCGATLKQIPEVLPKKRILEIANQSVSMQVCDD